MDNALLLVGGEARFLYRIVKLAAAAYLLKSKLRVGLVRRQ